ncbi:methyltransferase domain-containing protein [Sulfurovum sp.]|uniref:protein-L-isoaspartate O-methyltransferase family protein n=1 Tax=Sulfurovum sp. TaxID=1969726 RepID=UPI00286805C5|nr:methyltransferase domain-containing protein [Sulfurovum sp.]
MSYENSMEALVDSMIVSGVLSSENIIAAFTELDRKYFVPKSQEDYIYIDVPLPIGNEQTISQPSTVAFMLEHLGAQSGDKVLDIGAGSGWTTALLCYIVGDKGSVIGLERVEALVEQGKENLLKLGIPSHCHISKAGTDLGMPSEQFDRILVSAGADGIPKELFSQLTVGGTLIIPIRESIYKFIKVSESEVSEEEFYGFRFVPLVY